MVTVGRERIMVIAPALVISGSGTRAPALVISGSGTRAPALFSVCVSSLVQSISSGCVSPRLIKIKQLININAINK